MLSQHLPSQQPRQHRARFGRKGGGVTRLTFKAQLLMTFAVLVVITIFVLMISLMMTKHTRPRTARHRRRQQLFQKTLYNHAMRKRSPDEASKEDVIHVAPLSNSESEGIDFDEQLEFEPEYPAIDNADYVCAEHDPSDAVTWSSYVVLFTFIPTTISSIDLKYALSTIRLWAVLDKNIQTVVYVPSSMNRTTLRHIAQQTCANAIHVQLVDKIVIKSHATMRTLFEQCYHGYNATWYGYAEYGTLFDRSLYPALKMLGNCPNVTRKGNLVLGQSHSMELRDWDPSIAGELDIDTVLEHINTFTVIDEEFLGNGVHYYFTTKHGFPWEKIPALIPGSAHLDSFLMWYTMKNTSIAGVDATDAIFTFHQNDLNITDPSTYSKNVKVYNEVMITKAKYPLYYKKGLGVIDCIEYILDNANSPYHVLTRRHRKYIRRVVKGKAVTLSYYCKLSKTDKVALVEKHGVVINQYLA